MDSVDISVLRTLHEWQAGAQPVWLVTVVDTFGSSPRPKGAMLALRGDGLAVGSVSGGCIEEDLSHRAWCKQLRTDRCDVVTYGLTREETRRFGLPCGGTMSLVIEPVHNRGWPGQVLQAIQSHSMVRRTLHLGSMQVELHAAASSDVTTFDGEMLTTVHGPRWRLLIIGAGQTSAYLARMAQALDYQVTVCDPTVQLRETWDVPDTVLSSEMPDDAVLGFQVDACTAIVALAHDPKLDDLALLEALKSPAFYVGALGSKATNAKRRERLASLDLSGEEIARLHGPVGLPIGSHTPPEIAVSILAHLIAVRNRTAATASIGRTSNKEVCS